MTQNIFSQNPVTYIEKTIIDKDECIRLLDIHSGYGVMIDNSLLDDIEVSLMLPRMEGVIKKTDNKLEQVYDTLWYPGYRLPEELKIDDNFMAWFNYFDSPFQIREENHIINEDDRKSRKIIRMLVIDYYKEHECLPEYQELREEELVNFILCQSFMR